jgi:hypothetical protein
MNPNDPGPGPCCPDCEECPCKCPPEFNPKTLGLPPHVSILMEMLKDNGFIKTLEYGGRVPIPIRPFKISPGEKVLSREAQIERFKLPTSLPEDQQPAVNVIVNIPENLTSEEVVEKIQAAINKQHQESQS